MDDILKIILKADLEDSSLESIMQKLTKLKTDFSTIKIKITEEGNFAENINKLMKNLDTLNGKMSEQTEKQIASLDKLAEQHRENAELISKYNKEKINETNKLIQSEENLLKVKTKYNEAGKVEGTSKTYGNKNVQQTLVFDDKNVNQSSIVVQNAEKMRQEFEKMKQLSDNIKLIGSNNRNDDQKEFLVLQNQLNKGQGDYVNTSNRLNQIYDDLTKKQKVLLQLEEERKQVLNHIKEMEKRGAKPSAISPLKQVLDQTLTKDNIFGTDNKNIEFEKELANAIKVSNEERKRGEMYEKNLLKIQEAREDIKTRKTDLSDKGYDVKGINELISGQLQFRKSSEEVAENIKKINAELTTMEKFDKKITDLSEKAKKMGLSFENSFKNLNADQDINALNSKLIQLQQTINESKRQGIAYNDLEIQKIQQTITELQQEAEVRKSIIQQKISEDKFNSRIKGDKVVDNDFGKNEVNEVFDKKSYLERIESAKELARQYVESRTGVKNLYTEMATLTSTQDKLNNETLKITYQFKDVNGEVRNYSVAVDQATKALYDMGNASERLKPQRSMWENLSESIRRVPVYLASFGIAYEVMNQIQQSFRTLYDVDEAMTNLSKVTDATTQEFEEFRTTASSMGQELGATTTEVINAVTEFQKLGYTFQESKGLGETALVYSNVGDMEIETATGSLISALKGFNVAQSDVVKESERYVDIFNEVGNNYAISSAGIGEALKRSSASLFEAGNTIEESVAMITASNAVIQDEKKVGTAMKTVAMRLRGIDEETGDVVKSIPTLQRVFKEAGVNIMKDANTFKSTFEIMGDLAEVWNTGALSDMQKANLVESIAGKHHGTTVSAMLNNWKDAQNSYTDALNSSGSASREFAKYQDSLIYRVDKLKATYEEFWLKFWDDEAIKSAITGLTNLVKLNIKLIDVFGSLTMIGSVLVPMLMLFNTTLRTTFITGTAHVGQFALGLTGLRGALAGVTVFARTAGVAIRGLLIASVIGAVIGAVFTGLAFAYDKIANAHTNYIATLDEQYETQKKLVDTLNSIDLDKYKQLAKGYEGGTLNSTELQEYLTLQDQLKETGIDVISHYDEQGNVIFKSAEALKKLNEERTEEIKLIRDKKVEAEKEQQLGETGFRKFLAPRDVDKQTLQGIGMGTDVDNLEAEAKKVKKIKDELTFVSKDMDSLNLATKIINESDLGKFKTNSSQLSAEVNRIKAQLKSLYDEGKLSKATFLEANAKVSSFRAGDDVTTMINNLNNLKNNVQTSGNNLQTELNQAEAKVSKSLKEVEETLQNDFESFLDENDIDFESNAGQLADKLKEAYIKAISEGEVKEVSEAYDNFGDNIGEALRTVQNEGIDLGDLLTGTPQAVAQLQSLIDQFGTASDQGIMFANVLRVVKENLQSNTIEQTLNITSISSLRGELNTIMSDYNQRATTVAESLKSVNNGEALSVEQVNQLLGLYPQLNNAIVSHNGVLSIKKEALMAVMTEEENTTKNLLTQLRNRTTAELNSLKVFLGIEKNKIKAIDQTQKATNDASQATIGSTAKGLANLDMQRVLASNADAHPAFQLTSEQISGRYEMLYSYHYGVLKKSAKGKIADLEGYIATINALEKESMTQNINNKVDPPKAVKDTATGSKANEKQKSETEQLVYVTDKFKETMRMLNEKIREQHDLMMNFPTYSKDYQKALKNEIGLIAEKIKAINDEEKSIQKQIDNKNIQKTGLIKANEATRTTTTSGGGTTPTLKVGSRGESVKQLQRKLGVSADGIFGNQTANAVRNFQRSKGLTVDGIAGKQTLSALGMATTGGGTTTTTSTGGGGISSTLKVGSRGESVKQLQRKLGINADGIYGNQTANAVRNYQKSKGLTADAIAGKNTLSSLGLWGAGGGAVSTANASAKMQEEIDKAKDELAGLGQDKSALRQEYYDKIMDLVDSEVQRLDRESKKIEDDLVENDFLAEKIDTQTKAWRDNRGERLKLLQVQADANAESIKYLQSEIDTAEHVLNEKLSDAIYDLLDEQKINYTQMQQNIYGLQQEMAESLIDEIVGGYEKTISDSDNRIAELEREMERLAETDLDKYAEKQNEIAGIYEYQIQVSKLRLAQLKAEENTVKQFPELYKSWKEQVSELEETQKQLNQTLFETQKDLLDSHENAINDLIENYKEYYESRQDLELEAIEEIIDKEEELHDKRLDQFEEEFKAYEDNINKQLEALDKAEAEKNYQKNLQTGQKSRQDILNTIGLVSLDSSVEGKARLRQLQDELKTITEEIAEMQNQKQLDGRRKALEDQLNARAKENEKLAESEDKRYETEMEKLEKHQESVERKWENLINNERKFAQMREDLLAGNVSEMSEVIDSFVKLITESSIEMGESISQNLIDNFINARKELLELDAVLTDSQINFNNNNRTNANWLTADMINNIPLANPLANLTTNANNLPANTVSATVDGQVINLTINIDNVAGGEEGANQIIDAIISGLERKGVTI